MTYTSAAEDAASIRAELKSRHGWTSRQVSVKAETYSMGSSIHVRIKVPGISKAAVQEIAERFERVRRCEISGEILSGGNRFVEVSFDYALIDSVAEKISPWLASLPIHENMLHEATVGGVRFYVGRQSEWRYSLFRSGNPVPVNDAGTIANVIARAAVEASVDFVAPEPHAQAAVHAESVPIEAPADQETADCDVTKQAPEATAPSADHFRWLQIAEGIMEYLSGPGQSLNSLLVERSIGADEIYDLCATAAAAGFTEAAQVTNILGAVAADRVTGNAARLCIGEPDLLAALSADVARITERMQRLLSSLATARKSQETRHLRLVRFPG